MSWDESNDLQHKNLSSEQNENQEIRRTVNSIDYDRIDLQIKQQSVAETEQRILHQTKLNALEIAERQEALRQQQARFDAEHARTNEINANLSLNNQNSESSRSIRLTDNNMATNLANLNNIDNDTTKDKIENAIFSLQSALSALNNDNVADNQNKK